MIAIENELEKFILLANPTENKWDESALKNIGLGIIFLKFYGNSLSNHHYLDSLVQDSLAIIDSLSQKSERYYHFILRSYIENFMRVLLTLDNSDSMGVMKLFNKCKKLLEKHPYALPIFEQLENQYDECCLFVHSNIRADIEINVYYKMVVDRNDFKENSKVNLSLKKYESILSKSIKMLLVVRSDVVDSSFYRNKDILRSLISEEDYLLFTSSLTMD